MVTGASVMMPDRQPAEQDRHVPDWAIVAASWTSHHGFSLSGPTRHGLWDTRPADMPFDVFVDIADVAEKEARRAGRAGQLSATAAPTRASADRDLARRVRAGRGNCAYGEGFISHHPLLPAGDRPRPAHGARLRPRGDGALFVQASGLNFGPTVVAHVLERVRQRHAQAAPALRSPRTYLSSTVAVSAAPLCLRRCAPASYRNSCYYSRVFRVSCG